MQRLATFQSPLGEDTLMFRRLRLVERLSQPFEAEVELVSRLPDIAHNTMLGQAVAVKLETHAPQPRFIHAHIARFAQVGRDGRYHVYRAELRPWFWFLQRTADCKIFQNLSVPEIVRQVFADHPVAQFAERLAGSYPKRDYCVQYNESDFNFVSRLLEQEGISYWFEHKQGQHQMVLGDGMGAHQPLPGYESLLCRLNPSEGLTLETETVSSWQSQREVLSGQHEINDYDFLKPRADLTSRAMEVRSHALADYDVYHWPGDYIDPGNGQRYAQMQIDELQARHQEIHAGGPLRGVAVGRRFSLTEHPRGDENQDYLVVSAELVVSESNYASGGDSTWEANTHFTVLPWKGNYRPPRTTERPIIPGPQTAVVVGPPGEEIWIDEHGRVKVQFHWDRYGKKDDKSSCWIRVAQPWAGVNFGMVAHPRIGQEVVVQFLDGNPDTPLITGRVYNALSMPPWQLPANKTQSGILSRSTPKGGYDNANAIRFEDKKGEEQVWIHAEKNQDIEVENDETHWVGRDRTKTIDRDETVHVKHNRTETVDNDETITVHNNRTERVDHNEKISIGDNRDEDVGKNENVKIGDNQTLEVGKIRKKTVHSHEKDDIGRNWSIHVGRFKTETINLAYMQNVGLAKMVNIGAAYNVNVGAAMATTVVLGRLDKIGRGHVQTVGDDKSVKVGKTYHMAAGNGGSHLTMDDDSITLQVGKSTLVMRKDGTISINGHNINVGASGAQHFKADGNITLKGRQIHEN
ncbi:type VI secretion system Vgr family protein [Chitinimonas lacunae]|uniref:Type VI secretion system Vgr family protein n=1 Tax=Chitinimonas lacunae TaxID=1963018 RepID=A0ABV8MX37_9NEIS